MTFVRRLQSTFSGWIWNSQKKRGGRTLKQMNFNGCIPKFPSLGEKVRYTSPTVTPSENIVRYSDLSDQELFMVDETLKSILESSQFRKSKRYPAFLEFIVRNSLSGNVNELKERTLGTEVFERPPDWDTGNDSIVRNAAVEVRKRMALYYSEHPSTRVRIDLPSGSYVAEFYFRTGEDQEYQEGSSNQPNGDDVLPARPTHPYSWTNWLHNSPRLLLGVGVLLLVAAAIGWGYWRHQKAKLAFWEYVLGNQRPVTLIAGGAFNNTIPSWQPDLPRSASQAAPANALPSNNTNWLLNDPVWVANICNTFYSFHKTDCTIIPASSLTLDSLSNKAVILLGSVNNPLTDQFLASLRYQFRTTPWVETLPHRERIIVDQNHPESVSPWRINHDPPSQQHNDYAILARFHSALTNAPVIVIAGMRPEGTSGAGGFITTPGSYQKILSMAPAGWKGTDFEAVLQIDATENNRQKVKILTVQYW